MHFNLRPTFQSPTSGPGIGGALWGLSVIIFASSIQAAPPSTDPIAFLEKHCLECHDADTAKGEISLEDLRADFGEAAMAETWGHVLEQVAFGEMPPKKKAKPEQEKKDSFIRRVESGLIAAGHHPDFREKLKAPEYGNYVDHDLLFDGSIQSFPSSPARLWKRGPHIFDSMLIRGIGLGQGRYGRPNGHLAKVKQPFTIEDKAGIKDYAAITFADSATLGTMLRNAEVIVDKHIGGAMHERHVREHGEIPDDQLPKDKKGKPIRPRHPKTPDEFAEIILGDSAPADAQVEAAIRKMFDLVVEREPGEEEIGKYKTLIRECIAEGGNAEGLRTGLVAIAISPAAIYRSEIGSGPEDEHGRQMLGTADLAYAISFALTDQKPDAALLEAAKGGKLATREDVKREVTRLWDDAETAKPRILRFFHEFFGYTNAPKVFKDTSRFGKDYRGVADKLVADADVLVMHIVNRDKDVLAELLTTEKYFVGHSGDNEAELQANKEIKQFYNYFKDKGWKDFPYATPKEHADYARSIGRRFAHPNGNVVKGWMRYLTQCDEQGVNPMPMQNGRQFITLYDLDEKTFDYPIEQPFVLAKGKRAGLLMHPAWLLAHSLNLDNDPVRRGKWIRERLLAGTIPELPISVDASIPEDPNKTLRERFEVIRNDSYCWRCHDRMNPLGMPFETFDDFGRHRDGLEVLHAPKKKTKAVVSTGYLEGSGDAKLDGEVEEPIEMMRRIAKSERARQSFVRHAFRYWMGRNETLEDSPTLIAADKAYVEHGGSFRALVISLITSDSFLYRRIEDQTDQEKSNR